MNVPLTDSELIRRASLKSHESLDFSSGDISRVVPAAIMLFEGVSKNRIIFAVIIY
jgi:hypothetical protein